jgi:SAM-dependent methyltransferase
MTRLEKRLVNRPRKAARNIQRLAARLRELDPPEIHDVLELGCGTGAVSAYLAEQHRMNVVGTDFDPDQIALARASHPESDRLRFRVEDAARLSFADDSFDLVLSQNVFHHVPDWRRAAAEVARVLRPGGRLVWYDLAFPGPVVRLFRPLLNGYGLYTLEEMRSAFDHAGLTIRRQQRVAHGPFGHFDLVLERGAGQ